MIGGHLFWLPFLSLSLTSWVTLFVSAFPLCSKALGYIISLVSLTSEFFLCVTQFFYFWLFICPTFNPFNAVFKESVQFYKQRLSNVHLHDNCQGMIIFKRLLAPFPQLKIKRYEVGPRCIFNYYPRWFWSSGHRSKNHKAERNFCLFAYLFLLSVNYYPAKRNLEPVLCQWTWKELAWFGTHWWSLLNQTFNFFKVLKSWR